MCPVVDLCQFGWLTRNSDAWWPGLNALGRRRASAYFWLRDTPWGSRGWTTRRRCEARLSQDGALSGVLRRDAADRRNQPRCYNGLYRPWV